MALTIRHTVLGRQRLYLKRLHFLWGVFGYVIRRCVVCERYVKLHCLLRAVVLAAVFLNVVVVWVSVVSSVFLFFEIGHRAAMDAIGFQCSRFIKLHINLMVDGQTLI